MHAIRSVGGALTILLALNALVFAQGTADIVGRVTDTSGGVLPAVTVTAENIATKNVRTTITSGTGDYVFTLLPIGVYTVRIELPGFQPVNSRVELATGDRARVDARLQLGTVEESIIVTGVSPLLQTDSATVSSLIDQKTVQDAPIPGLNIITKSGGNQFHGSGFEFGRHERFDSRLFFAEGKPITRQNQYGGSLGGPIKSSKTFFFADYEGYRIRQGVPSLITVPTVKMRTGDFSELSTPIYDAMNAVRTPLPGNVIPAERFDPIAAKYVALYPMPTNGALSNNYAFTNNRTQNNQATDFRVDHRFNDNDTVFARYSYNKTDTVTPSQCPPVTVGSQTIDPTCIVGGAATGNYAGPNYTSAHNMVGSWAHVFSAMTISEIKANFSKPDILSLGPNYGKNLGDFFGVANANDGTADASGLPLMEMRPTPFAAVGETQWVPLHVYNTAYQVAGSVTQARGAHNLKIGGAMVLRRWGVLQSNSAQGLWGFDSTPTNSGTGTGGHAFASFLLGYPTDVRRLYTPGSPVYHTDESSAYVQDDWRATSWLTVNLGVRYDVFGPLTEKDDHLSNFVPAEGKMLVAGQDGVGRTAGVKTDFSNIGPRLGFSSTLPHQMVLCGGWGLASYPNNKNAGANMKNPPFIANYGPITSNAASNGVPNLFL